MNRIKQLREQKHLNQEGLALKLNVSQSSISYYETGERTPDLDILIKMSEFFDVSVDYLIGHSDVKKPIDANTLSAEDANLLADFSRLNASQKEKVSAFIQGLLAQ